MRVGRIQNLYDSNGWIREVLYCDPKQRRFVFQILSKEGRDVRLCWQYQKPEGHKDLKVGATRSMSLPAPPKKESTKSFCREGRSDGTLEGGQGIEARRKIKVQTGWA